MLQPLKDIEAWYDQEDPWNYESSIDDLKRRDILLHELPDREFTSALDIGCGHGFITRELPAKKITGVDISHKAIKQAKQLTPKKKTNISYKQGDLFTLDLQFASQSFDLIVITGVLYPQYIGHANTLSYYHIDRLLRPSGILVSVHIDDWYTAQFPYLMLKQYFYNYLTYTHRLEIYSK